MIGFGHGAEPRVDRPIPESHERLGDAGKLEDPPRAFVIRVKLGQFSNQLRLGDLI